MYLYSPTLNRRHTLGTGVAEAASTGEALATQFQMVRSGHPFHKGSQPYDTPTFICSVTWRGGDTCTPCISLHFHLLAVSTSSQQLHPEPLVVMRNCRELEPTSSSNIGQRAMWCHHAIGSHASANQCCRTSTLSRTKSLAASAPLKTVESQDRLTIREPAPCFPVQKMACLLLAGYLGGDVQNEDKNTLAPSPDTAIRPPLPEPIARGPHEGDVSECQAEGTLANGTREARDERTFQRTVAGRRHLFHDIRLSAQ
jgi:hypothetical protein